MLNMTVIYDCWGNLEHKMINLLHCEDGPAKIFLNGTKQWYINGVLHRIGGPAIEWCTGESSYYIDGILYSMQDYWASLIKIGVLDKFNVFVKIMDTNAQL